MTFDPETMDVTDARSDGKCSICRKPITVGEEIAWLKPSQLAVLNALGMSLKVFRRAHTKCLPTVLSTEDEATYRTVITELAQYMMDRTDPKWPKDCVGYNGGDAGYADRFLHLGCPSVGLHEMARRLYKYLDTQLGGVDGEQGKLICEAIEAGKKSHAALMARLRKQRQASAAVQKGSTIQDATVFEGKRPRGVVGINTIYQGRTGALGGQVGILVTLDHPNDNAAHGATKDKLKAAGAKWSGESRGWVISTDTLAAIWGEVFKETEVVVSEVARDALAKAEAQVKAGNVTIRKPGQVLVSTNGRTDLKVEIDPPWTNGSHAAVKDELRILGASWDKATSAWWLGASLVANNYERLFGTLDPDSVLVTADAQQQLEDALDREALSGASSLEDAGVRNDVAERLQALLPEGLVPRPYQLAGTAFVDAAGGRALIGDQMGLGKTIQSIFWLVLHPEERPAVLVVPSVVSVNWQDEINRWAPRENVQRIKTGKQPLDPDATCYVITYDLARRRVDELRALSPKVLVFDECQNLKNYKALRTKAMLKLVEDVNPKAVIGLSGTPVLNRPSEFYTILKMLRPADYRSWKHYMVHYCGAYKSDFGWQTGGATNTEELSERLRDTMVRRLKSKVLSELPAKTRCQCKVEVAAKDLKRIRETVAEMVDSKEPGAHLAAMTWERHETGRLKAQAAMEWIVEHADQGEPLLVFAHHHDVLDVLENGCREAKIKTGRIDQTASSDKRGALVKSFQAGDLDVMLLGIESGGVGITLTRASNVLFVERAWTPSAEEQAEDRAHRIGQEQAVTVRYLVADGTIDTYISSLIDSKRSVLDAILNGEAPSKESLDIRSELLSSWMAHHGLDGKGKGKEKPKARKPRQRAPESQEKDSDTDELHTVSMECQETRKTTETGAGGGGGFLTRPGNQMEMRW